ncbi:hypothetical protein A1Q1_04293 [Trichosporon asahii var. asahii CBS 2479]|uniref:Uncharacterized protein n=1 Tax=Trichosporon asahii var. asahii (strain ATCC 90039 / CBS 2479 / JCM 2466 / KCTC 7840 / NBRC 103889/ NCYC 2677 / UAMH 7654) TaxID=1186058 RepID=J4U911_TRIAS|nr:hypothetical protein A1Q1_04293 [Trichosporon asahii var. asahii CBS 2479]EJT47050.1 hypothetical protein A1Q1_04293 [Trichosporon asahii var. asahii CBS 2479]
MTTPPSPKRSREEPKSARQTPVKRPKTAPTPPQDADSRNGKDEIPTPALLYHLALSAHAAAHRHYTQAFVPPHVQLSDAPLPLESGPYVSDPHALSTALGLLVAALDMLQAALHTPALSDVEHAAFGAEFAHIGIKVLETVTSAQRLRSESVLAIDEKRLLADVDDTIKTSRSPHTRRFKYALELASARFAFMNIKVGRRVIKNALATTPHEAFIHRYQLQLLLLQTLEDSQSNDFFSAAEDLILVEFCHLARLRALFVLRKWDRLEAAMKDCATVFGLPYSPQEIPEVAGSGSSNERLWRTIVTIHYLSFRALYEGRSGEDSTAKACIAKLFIVMDMAEEKGTLRKLRANGGIVKTYPLFVQTTPVNILWGLAHLVTITRSYCTLRTSAASRTRRAKESYGISDSRHEVMILRAEIMMEQALAHIFRTELEEADKEILAHLRDTNLFKTYFPQVCMLHGQLAHQLGLAEVADRYYSTAKGSVAAGSEFGLVVEVNRLAAIGELEQVTEDPKRMHTVNVLADQCRSGDNMAFHAMGNFLSSIADPEQLYRLTQRLEEEAKMKESYAKHAARIKEMKAFGAKRFANLPARRRKERVPSSLGKEVATASNTDH